MPDSAATEFAPAARAHPDEIARQAALFTSFRLLSDLMDYVPDMILVLNAQRQVVFANRAARNVFCRQAVTEVLGLRPGELLGCQHAPQSEAGCGTTLFCRCCGAVKAILESQTGRAAVEECRIRAHGEHGEVALDLRVWATPMELEGERFTFFVLADIADEKRRQFLESTFLHDVINTAMSLRAVSGLLSTRAAGGEAQAAQQEYVRQIRALTGQILDQLSAHRQLVAAETGELAPRPSPVRSVELIEEICALLRPSFKEHRLRVADDTADILFETDKVLLTRVLGNMTRNALEASTPGETATIGCRLDQDRIIFWVHNRTYMPENVRLQIFSRSFSTKGAGRGLGTYAMKRLTERYLGGALCFTSTESEGTTFYASYPLTFPSS